MTTEELTCIEECRNLIIDFAHFIDSGQTPRLAELVTADATFARPTNPGVVISGAGAILEAFAARPRNLVTQHFNLNIRIRQTGPDTAEGLSIVVLYLGEATEELVPGKGRKGNGPIMGTWTDTFVRTAAGWRFKDRRGNVTMHA
ncbi:MAG: nuclear transport factor 2 family protein [Pseudomonadota bacterium]